MPVCACVCGCHHILMEATSNRCHPRMSFTNNHLPPSPAATSIRAVPPALKVKVGVQGHGALQSASGKADGCRQRAMHDKSVHMQFQGLVFMDVPQRRLQESLDVWLPQCVRLWSVDQIDPCQEIYCRENTCHSCQCCE